MAWCSSLGFQDGASLLMEHMILFHDHTMVILILVLSIVGYLMFSLSMNLYINRTLMEHQTIEVIWTIIPAVVLIFIAIPSLRLLYLLDEINNPSLTLKVIGHQCYWSYEYSDLNNTEFNSYMMSEVDLNKGEFRLLEVDNRVVIPYQTQIRTLISAEDVIHAWTVSSLGLKVDAVPGRLNQTSMLLLRSGLFYGQCSEICGANHSFMPIVIESVPLSTFIKCLEKYT